MPNINDLPSELLLEILSHFDDYLDVRYCSETRTILRAIAHHPTLDHMLFRSKDVKHKDDIIKMDTAVLHPVFCEAMVDKGMLDPKDPYIITSECEDEFDKENGIAVLDTCLIADNATSPPVSYLNFGRMIIENEARSAITVGQVFTELIRRNVQYHKDGTDWSCYELGTFTTCWRF